MSSSRPAHSASNSRRSKQSARIAQTTVDAKLHADFEGSGSSFVYSSSVRVASVEEEFDEVQQMRNTPDFFNKLVESIAPTMLLRRDINVCIIGDPSCAKSQFLKYTSSLVLRSVYTSGKSSSAAGL